jgi:hypothetical protein
MKIFPRQFVKTGVALAILAIATPALSQAQDNPAWLRFTVNQVKPEMVQEMEGYFKQLAGGSKKAGLPFYVVYQNFAGNLYEYTTVTPVMKFGDMDNPSPFIKVMGEEGWSNIQRAMNRCRTSAVRYYSLPLNDATIDKASSVGPYLMITRTQVEPSKLNDYTAWLKNDYKPAMEKAGVTWLRASRPVFGAPQGTYVETVRALKNLAEIDGGPILNKALGVEGARALNAKVGSIVRSSSIKIVTLRSDLSTLPAVGTGNSGN